MPKFLILVLNVGTSLLSSPEKVLFYFYISWFITITGKSRLPPLLGHYGSLLAVDMDVVRRRRSDQSI